MSLEENKFRIGALVDKLMQAKKTRIGKPEFYKWLSNDLLKQQRLVLESGETIDVKDYKNTLEDVIISAQSVQKKQYFYR